MTVFKKMEEVRRNKNISSLVDKMVSIEMMLRVRKPRHCILIEKDEEKWVEKQNVDMIIPAKSKY